METYPAFNARHPPGRNSVVRPALPPHFFPNFGNLTFRASEWSSHNVHARKAASGIRIRTAPGSPRSFEAPSTHARIRRPVFPLLVLEWSPPRRRPQGRLLMILFRIRPRDRSYLAERGGRETFVACCHTRCARKSTSFRNFRHSTRTDPGKDPGRNVHSKPSMLSVLQIAN